MGNEKSVPTGLKTDEIIKITDDWVQKSATLSNEVAPICVFEQYLGDDNVQTLQKLSKNLMLYRHPYILRYITSWQSNKTLHVATEYGKPLTQVIHDLMPMQLCIGLFNILKAIMFLQDMALSSHNNICKEAIYVTSEGYWKLGRLELMTKNQCENNSVKSNTTVNGCKLADHRGFADLAHEILQKETDDEIPGVSEFRKLCEMYSSETSSNTQFFQELCSHPFFTHEFVNIYSFLTELPVKSEEEKTDFFEVLADKLISFNEELVACQLGTLLLSRLVLLNGTAQNCFLQRLFTSKEDDDTALFTKPILRKYILPKLLDMFSLRDSQIRLILLKHFSSFKNIFSKEQLQSIVLPELLVGIKDTNEILVAATLHTLADLVPILGASVVIGKGRAKLFADGRPLLKREPYNIHDELIGSDLLPVKEASVQNSFSLTERPSPDGGEDCSESNVVIGEKDSAPAVMGSIESPIVDCRTVENGTSTLCKSKLQVLTNSVPVTSLDVKVSARKIGNSSGLKVNEDLSSLDIKCSRSKTDTQFDDIELMFKDMEPVISRTAVMKIPCEIDVGCANKFKAADVDCGNLGGWGDDIADWDNSEDDI